VISGIFSAVRPLLFWGDMAFTDWSKDEKKQIIDILKDCPASVRLSVRDRIKDMSAEDALETVKALLSSSEDVQGDNIPLSKEKPLKDLLSPSETMQGDDIGNKSKKPLKAVKSPLETKSKAGSRQTKSPGSSYKEKKSPAKPVKHPEAVKGSIKPLETVKALEKPLERVQGDIMTDNFDIMEIKARVDALISSYTSIHDIQDLTKAPQRFFTALSAYIGDNLFKGTKILKDTSTINNGSCMPSTCDRYNWDRVAACISLYVNLCNLYNKSFLFDGIAAFLGCGENTLKDNNEKLTQRGVDIYEKREASLSAGVVDTKTTNVTGLLAGLNHWHQWSGTGANRTEVRETTVMYPVLVDINKSTSEGLPDNSNK